VATFCISLEFVSLFHCLSLFSRGWSK